MNRNIPSTEDEQTSLVERLLQQGRMQGREEGREEGGRQRLIRIAERCLGLDAARELAAIEDVDELELAVSRLLDERA